MRDPSGVWRLVEWTRLLDGGVEHPAGPDARGLLIYTPDGWMSVHIACADGSTGAFSYTGRWELHGDEVHHLVALDARPQRPGSTQVRGVRWEGEDLVLVKAPPGEPVELVRWRRAGG